MTGPEQSAVRNLLLRVMEPGDFALLRPRLTAVVMQNHAPLSEPGKRIEHLYFPETGIASVTAGNTGVGNGVEVGLIGREGLVGAFPILLGGDRLPLAAFTQVAGEMFRIETEAFNAACAQSASLRDLLLRYVQSVMIQTTQTAFANAAYTIELRLARWLLMCQDRLLSDDLVVTHEFLSMMLGVQRTSVTLALQTLEGAGMIRARRGRTEIKDRGRLIAAVGDGYGVAEAEYRRLIGPA